jgi:hypothetical protein
MSRISRRVRVAATTVPSGPAVRGRFSVHARRTLAASAADTFAAWTNPWRRSRWFTGVPLRLRTATSNRTLRLACGDDDSDIEVRITPKGRTRCVVQVDHIHLATPQLRAERRHCWKEMLACLKQYLERSA